MELYPPAHFPGAVPGPRKGLGECWSPPAVSLCVVALGLQVAQVLRMLSGERKEDWPRQRKIQTARAPECLLMLASLELIKTRLLQKCGFHWDPPLSRQSTRECGMLTRHVRTVLGGWKPGFIL